MVPLGETRAAAARVKRRALTTLQRDAAATGDRTPTSAVPGPHASLITMATWSEWPDSNRSSSAWKAEVLPLDDTRSGSAYGYRVPPRWRRGMLPPHPGRTWTGVLHRSIDKLGCQRSRSCELVGGKGFEPNRSLGRTGLRPVSGPSARTARWRQRQDSNLDPGVLEARMLPLHHAVYARFQSSKTQPPCDLARASSGSRPNKKGLLGDRPRRPRSPTSADLLGRFALPGAIGRTANAFDPRTYRGSPEADGS